MIFYAIHAVVTYKINGYSVMKGIPTFYLCSQVQGIVDDKHAEKIAVEIINPTNNPDITVSLYATPLVLEGGDPAKVYSKI